MGKILECGAMASTPGTTSDCMMAYLREDCFIVEPTNPLRKCIPSTVAAHTLYEKSSPLHIIGPEGVVDVTGCKFEQDSERAVKVSGSKLKKSETINIKLEGASKVAYRTICIAGLRDPIMIKQIDECEEHVRYTVATYFNDIPSQDYRLIFHVYGKNGVMGELEPREGITSHELCLILEVVAKDQELANTICAFARSTLMHYSYKGRIATAGNLAFPYAPSDIPTGAVYRFNIHHLVEVDDPDELFFKDKETYEKVKRTKVITKELIAKLYHIPIEKVLHFVEFDPANAIKATIVRPVDSGSIGETDVYGAQQHAPLLDIKIPYEE
jgi:hypothetical protein